MCSLYLPMKRHPVCITPAPTAYATIDTTIIHHVYKPAFTSLRSYFLDRKLGPVCHQIGGRVRSSFLLGQWSNRSQFQNIRWNERYLFFITFLPIWWYRDYRLSGRYDMGLFAYPTGYIRRLKGVETTSISVVMPYKSRLNV